MIQSVDLVVVVGNSHTPPLHPGMSRRKQAKPQRLQNVCPATTVAGVEKSSILDCRVSENCCRKFGEVDDFINHKRNCQRTLEKFSVDFGACELTPIDLSWKNGGNSKQLQLHPDQDDNETKSYSETLKIAKSEQFNCDGPAERPEGHQTGWGLGRIWRSAPPEGVQENPDKESPLDLTQSSVPFIYQLPTFELNDHPISPNVPLGNDDDWESLMIISQTDETEQIRQMVGPDSLPTTDPNQCMLCRRVLSCKSALQMHYRTHTGERPFKCRICQRAFTTKGNLKTHMGVHRIKHPCTNGTADIHHQCPICQKRFLSSTLLQQHISQHTDQLTKNGMAQMVDNPRRRQNTDDRSMINEDSENGENRGNGGNTRTTSETVPTQLSLPLSGPPISAVANSFVNCRPPQIPLLPNLSFNLFNPVSSSINPNFPIPPPPLLVLPVVSLPAAIPPPPPLLLHPASPAPSLVSPTDQLFPTTTCDICSKIFACNSALEIHYRSHTGDRPFKCNDCDRGFSTRGNLKQHNQTHQCLGEGREKDNNEEQNENSSKLDNNNEQEQQQEQQQQQQQQEPNPLESIEKMWTWTESPPIRQPPVLAKHQCRVCLKHFSSSSALQIHMRTHTGDKPFQCAQCQRRFTTRGNLKVHMGTHVCQSPASGRLGRRLFDFDDQNGHEPPLMPFPSSFVPLPPPLPPTSTSVNSVEQVMWLWRTVCSVCQKVCPSPGELETHLKQHLSHSSFLSQ